MDLVSEMEKEIMEARHAVKEWKDSQLRELSLAKEKATTDAENSEGKWQGCGACVHVQMSAVHSCRLYVR